MKKVIIALTVAAGIAIGFVPNHSEPAAASDDPINPKIVQFIDDPINPK